MAEFLEIVPPTFHQLAESVLFLTSTVIKNRNPQQVITALAVHSIARPHDETLADWVKDNYGFGERNPKFIHALPYKPSAKEIEERRRELASLYKETLKTWLANMIASNQNAATHVGEYPKYTYHELSKRFVDVPQPTAEQNSIQMNERLDHADFFQKQLDELFPNSNSTP